MQSPFDERARRAYKAHQRAQTSSRYWNRQLFKLIYILCVIFVLPGAIIGFFALYLAIYEPEQLQRALRSRPQGNRGDRPADQIVEVADRKTTARLDSRPRSPTIKDVRVKVRVPSESRVMPHPFAIMSIRIHCLASLAWLVSAPLLAQDDLPDDLKRLGAKVVADNAFKSSFSPDGKKLVVGRMPVGSGLSVVDLAEDKATEITKAGKDPAWQPKRGKLIAYVQKGNLEEEIWLVDASGENDHKLIDASFPSWSSDGLTLFCHSRRTRKTLVFDMSGEVPKTREDIDIPFSFYPVVSPDGEKVAYHVEEKLQVYDLKAGKLIRSWPVPGWKGLLPAWSPDGKFVAFGTYGHGDGMGFWLLDIPSGRVREILKGSCTMAAWSPDGKQFAFDLRDARQYRVLVVDAANLPGMGENAR